MEIAEKDLISEWVTILNRDDSSPQSCSEIAEHGNNNISVTADNGSSNNKKLSEEEENNPNDEKEKIKN